MRIAVEPLSRRRMEQSMEYIRKEDLKEWYAGTGSMNIPSLMGYAYEGSAYGYVAVDTETDIPQMAFGVDPWEYSVGNVWMFASDGADKLALSLHKALLPYLHEMQAMYGTLRALSDSRNEKHHRWLEWLGFVFQEETFAGPFGLPFKLYIRRQPCA